MLGTHMALGMEVARAASNAGEARDGSMPMLEGEKSGKRNACKLDGLLLPFRR